MGRKEAEIGWAVNNSLTHAPLPDSPDQPGWPNDDGPTCNPITAGTARVQHIHPSIYVYAKRSAVVRSGTRVWDVQDVNGGDNRLGGVWGQYSRWLIEGGIAPGHGELRAGVRITYFSVLAAGILLDYPFDIFFFFSSPKPTTTAHPRHRYKTHMEPKIIA